MPEGKPHPSAMGSLCSGAAVGWAYLHQPTSKGKDWLFGGGGVTEPYIWVTRNGDPGDGRQVGEGRAQPTPKKFENPILL